MYTESQIKSATRVLKNNKTNYWTGKETINFENVVWVIKNQETYHIPAFALTQIEDNNQEMYINGINYYLKAAVTKRYITTERPIACLLSGGLDSSLIAALVCEINKGENN